MCAFLRATILDDNNTYPPSTAASEVNQGVARRIFQLTLYLNLYP